MEHDKNDAYFVFLPRFPLTHRAFEKRESILLLQLELLHSSGFLGDFILLIRFLPTIFCEEDVTWSENYDGG